VEATGIEEEEEEEEEEELPTFCVIIPSLLCFVFVGLFISVLRTV
jgi:hypothetical protein